MFTQCSKCETVFRLSADSLRAAGGQVRCGRCGEVFNALARLAEDAAAFTAGESPLDLESRADAILQSAPQAADGPAALYPDPEPAGTEIAHLQVLDESDWDTSLEFTLPPGELDRIFVQTPPLVLPGILIPPEPPGTPGTDLEISEETQRAMLAAADVWPLPEITAPRTAGIPFAAWLGAAIFLALLLGAQVLHQNPDWLRPLFPGFAAARAAPILSVYQLRQWGVTGDPDAGGTLRVRASILNAAAQPEPYPLLRVTLADRFGARIGARDFEPAEYLGKPAGRMLAPGERIDASMDILDPGKDAQGFEIDVCLRGADQRVACAADVGTQTK